MIEVFEDKRVLSDCNRIVVKIGSALLTANGEGLNLDAISHWAEQLAQLHFQGHEILLVSSGAVAEGMVRMQLKARPTELPGLQACAAIGQMGLVQAWSSVFEEHSIRSAQILITHDDLADRRRYLNSCDALQNLVDWRVIPVINENDTVATNEIRFGDNDTLAAMVAAQVQADALIILTDQNQNKITMNSSGIEMTSPKDIILDAKGKIEIKAAMDLSAEGLNVNVKANAQFKAEGTAGATLETPAIATVKGSMVMIN